MALTDAQVVTLNTDIDANSGSGGDFENVPQTPDGAVTVANAYNANASPDYWIFRNMVPSEEVRDAINAKNIADITSADRERAVALLDIRMDRGFSGEDADDRAAWDDIFSAATGDESQQAILALWSRLSTRGEKVFALSTGAGSGANPDTTSFQGSISTSDILRAWAL